MFPVKNTHSNKKLQGLTIKRKDSAIASNCPFCIVHTVSKNTSAVKIKHVVADHNHPTNVSNVLVSRRKSGISGREAVTETTNLLAPILSTGQKVNCNLVRKIIQPHVCPTVVLDATRVINIVRGVKKNMKDNIYNGTIMDEKSLSIFDKFSSSEASADNCREVLDNLKSDNEKSWIVYRLFERLKEEDKNFDYRFHYNDDEMVIGVVWQKGIMRSAFLWFNDVLCLDMKKSRMNIEGWAYCSVVGVDGNKTFFPFSEAFVIGETNVSYEFCVQATIEMTIEFGRNSVKLVIADDIFKSANSISLVS